MTLILYALGGLAALVVALIVAGLLLPERYTGRSQAVYANTPEEVWSALLDYDRHPMTGRMKKSVEPQPDENGLPVWVEDMGHGERVTVKTTAANSPAHMIREMASKAVPMTSRWEYSLEPAGDGCKLSIDAETWIRSGTWHVPLFRVMMLLGGGVKKGLDIQLGMVAATLGTADD